jgi:hypothetical protein
MFKSRPQCLNIWHGDAIGNDHTKFDLTNSGNITWLPWHLPVSHRLLKLRIMLTNVVNMRLIFVRSLQYNKILYPERKIYDIINLLGTCYGDTGWIILVRSRVQFWGFPAKPKQHVCPLPYPVFDTCVMPVFNQTPANTENGKCKSVRETWIVQARTHTLTDSTVCMEILRRSRGHKELQKFWWVITINHQA